MTRGTISQLATIAAITASGTGNIIRHARLLRESAAAGAAPVGVLAFMMSSLQFRAQISARRCATRSELTPLPDICLLHVIARSFANR
jgi:hypothetical protein